MKVTLLIEWPNPRESIPGCVRVFSTPELARQYWEKHPEPWDQVEVEVDAVD